MLPNNKKNKRRRYIRYPIELKAELLIEKPVSVQCRILDFCSGGFFLELIEANTEIPLHKNIKLRFTIGPESSGENFEINARAVHITSPGIGVAVDHMPVSVLNALTHAANADLTAFVNDRRSSTPNKINQEDCKKAFKHFLLDKLPPLLAQFFDSLSEELENVNQHIQYLANQSQLDDLKTTLQLNRETFVSEYCSSVMCLVDAMSEPHQQMEDNRPNGNGLSLVEIDEFEDWLTISAIIRKLNIHFEEPFNKLSRELARVFGLWGTSINNPISPAVLCTGFRELVLQFELSSDINATLYYSFEKLLVNGYILLCEQATQLLLKYGPADTNAASIPDQSNRTAVKLEPTPEPYQLPIIDKSFPNQNSPQPLLFENQPLTPDCESSKPKNLQPITQITGKLLELLNEMNVIAPGLVNRSVSRSETLYSSPAESCYSAEELINALAQIQNTQGDHSSLHSDTAALNQRLRETLNSLAQGTKSLSKKDSQQLEVYSKFFDTLFHDFDLSPEIKAYLEKIHLPLLALPLQGNDFLDDDGHPALGILNQLGALESALKNDKAKGQNKVKNALNRLIDRIVHEASSNPTVFTEVEHELEGITQRVTQASDLKIQQIIETHEAQQNGEILERSVQQTIDQRMAGRPIPAIIPLLLKSGWQQLLVNAELNQEKHPDEKLKYLDVLENLMFWYYEPDSIRKIQAGSIKKPSDL